MSEYEAEQFWRIDGVPANRLVGSEPTPSLGETVTYEFEFSPMRTENPDEYQKLYHEIIDKYSDHAGQFAPGEDKRITLDGTPWFREQHDKESLVISIEPPEQNSLNRGMWGIIESIQGETKNKGRGRNLKISIRYLADLDEYPSKEAVSNDLEATGL